MISRFAVAILWSLNFSNQRPVAIWLAGWTKTKHTRGICTTRVRRDGVEEKAKEATESVQTCVGDKFPEVTAPNNLLFAVSS